MSKLLGSIILVKFFFFQLIECFYVKFIYFFISRKKDKKKEIEVHIESIVVLCKKEILF